MTTQPWLVEHLIAKGHMSQTGVTRRVQLRRCKCRRHILTGFDHPTHTALEARVDPDPLTPLGEALARIEGRYTVSLNNEGGRLVLNERYDLQILAWPAGTRAGEDIHREHRCKTQPLTKPLIAASMFPAAHIRHLPAGSPAPF